MHATVRVSPGQRHTPLLRLTPTLDLSMHAPDSSREVKELQQQPMLNCRHCLLQIPAGAQVCTHCKQDQSKLRSWVGAVSSVAAAITVVGAAASYVITSAPQVRKAFWWKDSIEVLQYSSKVGLLAANAGDGQIHLSHIRLTAKKPDGTHLFARTVQIGEVIESGKFSMIEGDDSKRETKGRMPVMNHDTDQEFFAAILDSGDIGEVDAGKKCFLRVVYSTNDPLYHLYRDRMGDKLHSYPVSAQLHFHSLTTNRPFVKEIPAIGMLSMHDIERCRAKYIKNGAK